ncbi:MULTISPECIES: FecCD family ABC transporter permease [Aneurinibacillus]|uniref:Iron ABC transporter permease n=1 Tax=Aneurinibacillus thermoaerophilus TaxID=143495 RepID=A0A1G8CS50_ANETH|nr:MULTISPECIES: iron ABC transporter permease [Aneurinibacillus]AMA71828.1 iron ABC transporter permease [Aneurinibacillus sp. XH2]MED0737240.1 iron ABC transporter permease [Aneurinibacillus thermoaerophilus]MED0757945.1 iron ABC transporter permease [Aneurinibacillus thermoaerophilus]MED0761643.1 iron ABC transporter permease [Aneurinibacillus thermoaerophilus]QYY42407.1 iron ABC transporter permease [Aneurinibacillus thermoaerophilus]
MNRTTNFHFLRTAFFPIISSRYLLVLLVLLLCNLVVAWITIGIGEFRIPFADVIKTLAGYGEKKYEFVIYTLRLPRTLVAFLVGIGLAVSGTILQALTRNPLASPSVIGLNAGAGLGASIMIILFPAVSIFFVPFAAFAGAFIAGALVYLLAWKNGDSPLRLVLIGIGIAAIAQAFILLIQTHGKIQLVTKATIWLVGSVYARGWEHVWSLFPWIFLLFCVTFGLARHLDILQLGDDIARGVGSRVEWQRGWLLLISIALAGASVAAAGVISFVGLMAPHISRRLVGSSHRVLLITAALVGGLLVMLSDLIGKTLFAPIEIPCGIVTAIIGVPYLIYLLIREQK